MRFNKPITRLEGPWQGAALAHHNTPGTLIAAVTLFMMIITVTLPVTADVKMREISIKIKQPRASMYHIHI